MTSADPHQSVSGPDICGHKKKESHYQSWEEPSIRVVARDAPFFAPCRGQHEAPLRLFGNPNSDVVD